MNSSNGHICHQRIRIVAWMRRSTIARPRKRRFCLLGEALEHRRVLDSTLVFNELMYHPAAERDGSGEWIELYSQMSVDMDLSGWSLQGGVEYEFPAGTRVGGHGYLIVAAEPEALAAETGLANVWGPFAGQLNNNGEEIRLVNHTGRVMNLVNYQDAGEWPIGPDGSGFTLAKHQQNTPAIGPIAGP